jgi:hypothetical protein
MQLATILAGVVACCASPAFAFNVYKVDPFCPDASVYGTIQDAVNAAALHAGADYVWISDNTDINGYKNQHVVVNDPDDVIIEGGFFDCTDFDPATDLTSISGAGNDGGPVFDIVGTGHTVYLGNLIISGAQRTSAVSGGGINFTGHGELDIAQSFVFNNHAGFGAGINVSPSGGQAVLKLLHDTTIYLNTAAMSGGGIRLEGDARLFVLEPKTAINGNNSESYGGGVLIVGPARADIASPGNGFGAATIAANYAANGGGVAVIDNGNGQAVLRVFADASHQPTPIVGNRASANGGAIYLFGDAKACVNGPHLTGNIAEDGAVTYYEDPNAGTGIAAQNAGVYINEATGNSCGPELETDLGGTTYCLPYAQCAVVSGSFTRHADDTPSSGSTFRAHGGDFEAARVRLQDNVAGSMMQLENATGLYLVRSLITDNAVSGRLISGPIHIATIAGCTIANNSIGGDHVFYLSGGQFVDLASDIIYQPGVHAIDTLGAGVLNVTYALSNDGSLLPINPTTVNGDPSFVDVASGDYRLQGTSLGIDFANEYTLYVPELYTDLDGNHTVDLPQVSNFIGPVDLGAYERQFHCALDEIFCDGFNR